MRQLREFIQKHPILAVTALVAVSALLSFAFLAWIGIYRVAVEQSSTNWLSNVPFRALYVLYILFYQALLGIFLFGIQIWYARRILWGQGKEEERLLASESAPLWVRNHELLAQHPKEFLPIIQKRYQNEAIGVRLGLASQGYSGSLVLFAWRVDKQEREKTQPQILKLDTIPSIMGEVEKYRLFVDGHLQKRGEVVGNMVSVGMFAGIAYELVGLTDPGELVSLQSFYQSQGDSQQLLSIIDNLFQNLGKSWYQNKKFKPEFQKGRLYDQYFMLYEKYDQIKEGVIPLLESDEQEDYRKNVDAANTHLERHKNALLSRPRFVARQPMTRWLDPLYFLLSWDRRQQYQINFFQSPIHGDLRAQNIILESAGNTPWFIDFSHAGNGLSLERTDQARKKGLDVGEEGGHTPYAST